MQGSRRVDVPVVAASPDLARVGEGVPVVRVGPVPVRELVAVAGVASPVAAESSPELEEEWMLSLAVSALRWKN